MHFVSLNANFESFQTLTFKQGLNVIVADRAESSSDTDSRNGLGKTTALALIDFCLGGSLTEQTRQMQGLDWEFTLSVISRDGFAFQVSRSIDSHSEVVLTGDYASAGVAPPPKEGLPKSSKIRLAEWTSWLSTQSFPSQYEEKAPSYRSLVKYFIRFRKDQFLSPFKGTRTQKASINQRENSYLLGLDWRLSKDWQDLADQKAKISLIDSSDSSVDQQVAVLEPVLAREQRAVERISNAISEFAVLPEYREIEERAQKSTARLKKLSNENFIDRQQLDAIVMQEDDLRGSGSVSSFLEVYTQAGIHLGDALVRTFEEASAFHTQVSLNRLSYLQDQKRALEIQIRQREQEQEALARDQQKDLKLLQSGGALEDYSALQSELALAASAMANTQDRISTLRDLVKRKSQITARETDLKNRTRDDIQDRFELRAHIVLRVSDIIEQLYGELADLRVSTGSTGAKFELKCPRLGSDGVQLMAIFAYDIALAEQFSQLGLGPGLIAHDSSVFADVDERQRATALQIAGDSASNYGYQHILTVNSDNIPWSELQSTEWFTSQIILRLDDENPSGSLLGMRLSPSSSTSQDSENSVG